VSGFAAGATIVSSAGSFGGGSGGLLLQEKTDTEIKSKINASFI